MQARCRIVAHSWVLGLGFKVIIATDLTADTSVSDQAAQLESKRVTSMQNIAAAARCCWEDTGKACAISCQPWNRVQL